MTGLTGVNLAELQKLKYEILSTPILAVIKGTCIYCTRFMNKIKELDCTDSLRTIEEGTDTKFYHTLRSVVKQVYNHSTVPAIFINGRFIGGYDDFQKVAGNVRALIKMTPLHESLVLSKDGVYPPRL